jgi:lipopolysaccharide transport system ATP-binding protein
VAIYFILKQRRFFMSSPEESAIIFRNVTKKYTLYQSKVHMILDALGLKKNQCGSEFYALKNINLDIKRGERIGIIGRNGAGKSTALKLITGNFSPTDGVVEVNGNVQALMNTGLGFHPEFSGLQNIKSSLIYNGLDKKAFQEAIDDIIDFVELGEFIHQPFKTYSLGMQSRLFFAVSTAIQPEILIVDEVLGAGDAYFSAKSADRMKKLTQSGCTLLLVSHSTQQILQFCDKAIWLECGEVIMEGKAIDLIKAYEAFSKRLEMEHLSTVATQPSPMIKTKQSSIIQSKWLREKLLHEVLAQHSSQSDAMQKDMSISRWPGHVQGLKIDAVTLMNQEGAVVDIVSVGEQLDIVTRIKAEEAGRYDVYFTYLLFTEDGRWVSRHCSDKYTVELQKNECYSIQLRYKEVLLGQGKYIFSAAIYSVLDLNDLSTARYYDLLSRSFEFNVSGGYKDDQSIIHHPADWTLLSNSNKEHTPTYELEGQV